MKIYFVIDSLGIGGAEKSTILLAQYLVQAGHQVKIYILQRAQLSYDDFLSDKGFVTELISGSNFLEQILYFNRQIRQERPDLVHSILFWPNLMVRCTKFFSRFIHLESLVNTAYSKERFRDPNTNKLALFFYWGIDVVTSHLFVDHFHAITTSVKEHYQKALLLSPSKISVIYRGRALGKGIKLFKERAGVFRLLNIGRQEFQKGQIYLLQALTILRTRGYLVHLTIVGREGAQTARLKAYILEHHLQHAVTLLEYVDDLHTVLLDSDLFIFPSLYEGLGGALIEAQAAGLPIACNDIPVLREVVCDQVNAEFFSARNVDSIVEVIEKFYHDFEKVKRFSKASFDNYLQKFSLEINQHKMDRLYQQLIVQS